MRQLTYHFKGVAAARMQFLTVQNRSLKHQLVFEMVITAKKETTLLKMRIYPLNHHHEGAFVVRIFVEYMDILIKS